MASINDFMIMPTIRKPIKYWSNEYKCWSVTHRQTQECGHQTFMRFFHKNLGRGHQWTFGMVWAPGAKCLRIAFHSNFQDFRNNFTAPRPPGRPQIRIDTGSWLEDAESHARDRTEWRRHICKESKGTPRPVPISQVKVKNEKVIFWFQK